MDIIFIIIFTDCLVAGSPREEVSFVGEDTVKTTMLLQVSYSTHLEN